MAVLEVLADVGYAGLTMDAVAATAGVSKATIYRRWRTKADLLVSVISTASDQSLIVPDTGRLRDDLVALLTALGYPEAVRQIFFGAIIVVVAAAYARVTGEA